MLRKTAAFIRGLFDGQGSDHCMDSDERRRMLIDYRREDYYND